MKRLDHSRHRFRGKQFEPADPGAKKKDPPAYWNVHRAAVPHKVRRIDPNSLEGRAIAARYRGGA